MIYYLKWTVNVLVAYLILNSSSPQMNVALQVYTHHTFYNANNGA